MRIKKYYILSLFLVIAFLLFGCNEDIDLVNIAVNDDLSTNVQIVVSPSNPAPESTPSPNINPEETKEKFFQQASKEFESCGFKTQKNLKYDADGVSGSQSFSSRTDLEQAFTCLSYTSDKKPPIELSYPTKNENILQSNYELQIGVKNPDFVTPVFIMFDSAPSLAKEIRVTLPGEIVDVTTKNQSSYLILNKTEKQSGFITFKPENKLKRTDNISTIIKQAYENLNIDTTGFDFERLNSKNSVEANQALEELSTIFKSQTGIDPIKDPVKYFRYIDAEIPPYTTIIISSSKSKIDIDNVESVALGILPFLIAFLVFLYKNTRK